jgi:hypothetical protein
MSHLLSWAKTACSVKRSPVPGKFFHFLGDRPLSIGVYLEVYGRTDDGTWPRIDDRVATSAVTAGSFSQTVLRAWDDELVAACNGGRILTFDGSANTWRERAGADAAFATKHQLAAFDPKRGLLVSWGSQKKNGRKDDTLVHDGTTWSKGKKAAGKWADLDTNEGNFCMYWDPTEGAVVRVGVTEVGVFDGSKWTQLPLAGGELLDDWDRVPCVDPISGRVAIVQRFITQLNVVRVHRDGARFVAELVATFPPAVDRAPNSVGSNAAFDACAFHAPTRALHAYDDTNADRYVTELAPLFA